MSPTARSLFVFGIYVALTGLLFTLIPNVTLGVLGQLETSEPWAHILGVILLGLAYYYIRVGLDKGHEGRFFRWSVHARTGAALLMAGLVLAGQAPRVVLFFALLELTGALWTALAVRAG